MTVDFAEHFWGEKHMGFSVLYQSMKTGQLAVKELAEFLKERSLLQEDHSKHLVKSLNKVSGYANGSHSGCKLWLLVKNTLERINQAQSRLTQTITELGKEVHKYAEELHKTHRALKDQEHPTFDAVNLIQTTTTCLQKAKETYTTRCVEVEKLKRESGTQKEISKAETKAAKAREEYKQYVEKYEKVREEFEQKLSSSARNFQEQERKHLERLKTLLAVYAKNAEECNSVGTQVYAELRHAVETLDSEEILAEIAQQKETGRERPGAVTLEEPDIASLFPPPPTPASPTSSEPLTNSHQTPLVSGVPGPELISLANEDGGSVGGSSGTSQNQEPSAPSGKMSSSSSSKKLTLRLVGRRKGSQTTTPVEPNPHEGFFKNRKKKKSKDSVASPTDASKSADLVSNDDARSSTSDEKVSRDVPLVDEEGFSIRPSSDDLPAHRLHSKDSSSCDSDSDDEPLQKIHVEIKPMDSGGQKKISNSVDELRDVVGQMGFRPSLDLPSTSQLAKSKTFDGSGEGERDPWAPPPLPVRPLKPSYTGDGRLYSSGFGLNETFHGFSGERSWGMPSGPLAASLTGSSTRPRPRSHTPTNMFPLSSQSGFDDSSGGFSRSDSMGSLGDLSMRSSSPLNSPNSTSETIPVAMMLTETVHAMFVGSDVSRARTKVFGSVQVSFPGSAVRFLVENGPDAPEPLCFRIVSAERIHAVIPNKQVLSADAVSQFASCPSHEFSFDSKGLGTQLQKLCQQRPGAPFYNLEVLRYEVRQPVSPVVLVSYWKCDRLHTDLRLDYRRPADCSLPNALLNLQFVTKVNGGVSSVSSKPEAEWSDSSEHLLWRVTELSAHGEAEGSLKARLSVSRGPSTPAPTHLQFQAADATLSGASLTVVNDQYRLSLLKRKLASGKFFCEPESR